MCAEAGLHFALNLHIKKYNIDYYGLVEKEDVKSLVLEFHPKRTDSPKIQK